MVAAVLIRISTQEIVKKSIYPSKIVEPIKSLDKDLKWLIVHELDKPNYDPSIEKLEKVEAIMNVPHPDYPNLDKYKISYNVVPLSEEELDANEEIEAEQKQQQHIDEGETLFRKTYAKIWRRKNKTRNQANKLELKDARNLMEWLQPVYEWLLTGNFHQANKEVNKKALSDLVANENVAGITDTYNSLVKDISDYFKNNYDL